MPVHRDQYPCVLRLAVGVVVAVLVHSSAFAQRDVAQATVVENAPIFIYPDATRQPLRVAAANTRLDVLGVEGAWLNVRFQDPQYGPRVGYIEAKFVRRETPDNLRPLDLSVPRAGLTGASTAQQGPPEAPQRPVSQPQPGAPQFARRQGFWFNAGFGYGSLGCDNCDGERADGFSGGLSAGGVISPRVLLGVGTTGWYRSVDGVTLTMGTLDARVRVYPWLKSGFFVTGGLGVGSVSLRVANLGFLDENELGVGAVVGVGWDIPVGRNVSLTPFYNGFAMRSDTIDANVGQIGLGVTIH